MLSSEAARTEIEGGDAGGDGQRDSTYARLPASLPHNPTLTPLPPNCLTSARVQRQAVTPVVNRRRDQAHHHVAAVGGLAHGRVWHVLVVHLQGKRAAIPKSVAHQAALVARNRCGSVSQGCVRAQRSQHGGNASSQEHMCTHLYKQHASQANSCSSASSTSATRASRAAARACHIITRCRLASGMTMKVGPLPRLGSITFQPYFTMPATARVPGGDAGDALLEVRWAGCVSSDGVVYWLSLGRRMQQRASWVARGAAAGRWKTRQATAHTCHEPLSPAPGLAIDSLVVFVCPALSQRSFDLSFHSACGGRPTPHPRWCVSWPPLRRWQAL